MQQSLEKRIAALEQASNTNTDVMIFIHLVGMGATDKEIERIRPLDLLRVHHERIEGWILEQAGIVFDTKAAPGALRVVQAA